MVWRPEASNLAVDSMQPHIQDTSTTNILGKIAIIEWQVWPDVDGRDRSLVCRRIDLIQASRQFRCHDCETGH